MYRYPREFSVVGVNRYGLPAGYVSRWRRKKAVQRRIVKES